MKVDELKIGALYGDNDGVDMLYYVGGTGYLYNFVNAEYDDEEQEFIPTKDDRILTAREVNRLIEW